MFTAFTNRGRFLDLSDWFRTTNIMAIVLCHRKWQRIQSTIWKCNYTSNTVIIFFRDQIFCSSSWFLVHHDIYNFKLFYWLWTQKKFRVALSQESQKYSQREVRIEKGCFLTLELSRKSQKIKKVENFWCLSCI